MLKQTAWAQRQTRTLGVIKSLWQQHQQVVGYSKIVTREDAVISRYNKRRRENQTTTPCVDLTAMRLSGRPSLEYHMTLAARFGPQHHVIFKVLPPGLQTAS
uniref:Uncharacterized protein n=1 Tax=Coccidioides posadasii RMSCC 3488 TaxID=454284 RepID=A0A0J6EZB9_COCPO|nr:hypothetical protein CPAG_02282 [Coccidioides posadasii RMSCC 3488]